MQHEDRSYRFLGECLNPPRRVRTRKVLGVAPSALEYTRLEAGCLPVGLLLKHRSLKQAFEYPAGAGDMTESVDRLLSTHEALSSILSTV